MRKLETFCVVYSALCANSSWAQQPSASAGTVVGVAYSAPNTAFQVAPGQVVSLMVYGLDYRLTQPIKALGTPPPKSLAGFSVDFQQFQTTIPVPILGIQQTACFSVSIGPCSALTNIVVQVPYEIKPDCLICGILEGARFFLVLDVGQVQATVTAYFPSRVLSATGGLEGNSISNWFAWPSRFWAVGPSMLQTIFDGGRRRATSEGASANYDATVANYRETTLTAFQQVEDSLAALRILEHEAQQQREAVAEAKRGVQIFTNR